MAGANSRHAALIEDAFDVLVETPGGGVSLTGDAKGRAQAKKAVQAIAERADQGLEIAEADVRVAIGNARSGGAGAGAGALPVGRRGQVAPKTTTQADICRRWPSASWCSASARPAPARPSWPWRMARACCCAARSTG